MLKFESEVPKEFRDADVPILVRSVGELLDQLAKLPRDLPMSGYFCRGVCRVGVTRILGRNEKLACTVEDYDYDEDED